MKASLSPTLPTAPRLFASLVAGFDSITNHIFLVLFPIGLDLLLWLGPHLRVKNLVQTALGDLQALPGWDSAEATAMLEANRQAWELVAERFNLATTLRTFPVGIPSLMSGRLPVAVPGGAPSFWEMRSLADVIGVWLLLAVIGLVAGTFYYLLVAQAALSDKVSLRQALADWPHMARQVIRLTIGLIALFIVISLPVLCVLSVVALGGLPLVQCGSTLYAGLLLWLLFPLLFAAHGIFVNRQDASTSLLRSAGLTRLTLSTTGLFFLIVLVLSQGLDLLWNVTPENSWIMLVGMGGHAFVTTGLLAASFVYYREADRWMQAVSQQAGHLAAVHKDG